MKWALILVFSSGIWDTGLTYRSFDDCFTASHKLRNMQVQTYYGESGKYDTYLSNRTSSHAALCVPNK